MGALNAESPKRAFSENPKKLFGHETCVFLTDFHHILRARSCDHFQCFPHTPMPSRPLKRHKNNDFLSDIFHLFLRVIGAIVLWCHRGAIRTQVPIRGSDTWSLVIFRYLFTCIFIFSFSYHCPFIQFRFMNHSGASHKSEISWLAR